MVNVEEQDWKQDLYYQQLTDHLEELEKAKDPGEANQAKFLLAFNNFKLFAVRHWNQIDIDFDPKTRRNIEKVFDIENSFAFLISKFFSESLDHFFRFAYILCFIL